ncbi:DUF2809 domain-containing protein [Paeniglutamicibacter sp. R2-26]|uniref:ribosomal maturation YjgA family protein n=1 Tax=Paeniglutamicibacter sp. R2-26 TaxID=3144417 RepID=UPI003EE55C68
MAEPRARRRRIAAALLVLPVIALGLAARFLAAGPVADLSGGVFYAVLVYVLLVFLRPGAAPWRTAAITLAFCTAIELLQLTPLPAALSAAFPPARLVLGSTFVPLDLAAYALGAVLALGIDSLVASVRAGRQ